MVIWGSSEALAEAKRSAKRWTLQDAAEVFPAVSELGEECGYRIALLGGTLTRGDGGDLDFAMLPLVGAEQLRQVFLSRFGGEVVRQFLNRERGVDHVHILKDGRLYDFCFGRFWLLRRRA